MPNVLYKPKWSDHEKDLHSNSLDTATKASEAFTKERDKELQTSAKARRYESSRREEALKLKPKWVKEKRAQEQEPLKKAIGELKQGGEFKTGLKSIMPGFVLVKPLVETQTDSGIFLANEVDLNTNRGEVIMVGGEIVHLQKIVKPPVAVGDRVMIKKGLPGLEMSIQGEMCLLMTWQDILAVEQ